MSTQSLAADTAVLNSDKFFRSLDRLMGASIGVIAVRTREAERARALLHEWASMRSLDFYVWNRLRGFGKFNSLPTQEDDGREIAASAAQDQDYLSPSEIVNDTFMLDGAMRMYSARRDDKAWETNNFFGVFMGLCAEEFDLPDVQQYIRDQVQYALETSDRMVFILQPGTEIPDALIGDVELVDLDPPSYAELADQLEDLTAAFPESLDYELTEDDTVLIVQNAMGMTEQEFGNAISLASVDLDYEMKNGRTDPITGDDFVDIVRKRKLEILKQTQILSLMPNASISNVGGLDLLKTQLKREKRAFSPEAKAFGIKTPKGFIVVGPPGGGKSLVAKATSSALGIPAIMFDFAAVFNSLVGSSEARLRMCLKMVEDMAPCILFIDEIEKALGSDQGGDGGTSARILGTFLTWMNDRADKGIPVYVVASANDVTKLPPELLRSGRFDTIWAVNYPSAPARRDIFEIHVTMRGHKLLKADYRTLAEATEHFVGAEIESVVEEALLEDFDLGHKKLQLDTLLEKVHSKIPQYKAFPARIKRMREWVEANAKPAASDSTFDGGEPPVKAKPKGISSVNRVRPRIRRKP